MVDASTDKGWVRDGILSSLAKGPRNSTEIAKELGVSKATVSYHTKSLVRKGMIEIADVRSVRGGVYSKTYALKPGSRVLIQRAEEKEESFSKLDELFERLLMSWHLNPERPPADEIKIFLYHAFRLLGPGDSQGAKTFEEFGARAGEELIATSLKFGTIRGGLAELVGFLSDNKMADMQLATGKSQARLSCASCFENDDHGNPVCEFTKGVVEGVLKAKRGTKYKVDRKEGRELPACVFTISGGRFAS